MKKAIAIKLNDHYAKLTDGSCPSHHYPNDVIRYQMKRHVYGQETLTIFDQRASQVEAYQ